MNSNYCFHCCYPFKNINTENINFQGYSIFDENYNFEIYKFCSLNCGLKYIMSEAQEVSSKDQKVSGIEIRSKDQKVSGIESQEVRSKPTLVRKLKNFFDFYSIDPKTQKISQALPIERLKVFNGDLSYEDYRKDFICPFIDTTYIYEDSSFIEYEVDYEDKISEDLEQNILSFT